MPAVRVSTSAFVHTADVRFEERQDASALASAVDLCVERGAAALLAPAGDFTEHHRWLFGVKLRSMQSVFRHVRAILGYGFEDPRSVDALAVARLALEDLFALCLMFEGAQHVRRYLQDSWRRDYVRFLLQAQETKNLPRFAEYNEGALQTLKALRAALGVTDAQEATVRHDELGEPLPVGVAVSRIERFPTPSDVVKLLPASAKKRMLGRLYLEYQQLSGITHGLNETAQFRTMFGDQRFAPYRFPEEERKDTWQRHVCERSFLVSALSVAQAAAELTSLYPGNVGLRGAAMELWQPLTDGWLLSQAVWQLRARELLGALR